MLPDFLWVALMLGRRSDWSAAYAALDVLDRFVPEDVQRILDGRLTSFAIVPDGDRAAARDALQREAPHALPSAFGHVLGFYPTCPARWLYRDWLDAHEPDPAIGLPLVRSLVQEHTDKGGVRETRLRMVAIARNVVHRRITHSGTEIMRLVPRYPGGLSASELGQVESIMRAMWAAMRGMDEEHRSQIEEWPRAFWRRNRELVSCSIPDRPRSEVTDVNEEDGPLDPEPLLHVSEMRDVLTALHDLGSALRAAQLDRQENPENDESAAVLFGLASRMFRLLHAFIERPSAWAATTIPIHLRGIVDVRILSAWLMHRDDPSVFAAYREYGLGQLKLLYEHMKADLGDDVDVEAQRILDALDAQVNLERDDWAQPVNLGSFAGLSIRKMAIEADLKREYQLVYAPYSSEIHGEWPSVRDEDTVVCTEPLHMGHRVGAFRAPSRTLRISAVTMATRFAQEGIVAVFGYFDIDVESKFAPLLEALDRALYASDSDPDGDQVRDD
jgi:hypothetical protein